MKKSTEGLFQHSAKSFPVLPRGRRRFALGILILILGLLAFYKNLVDLYDVRVVYWQAPPAVAQALRGMKIMFLSDIHVGRFGPRERFVLKLVEKEQPDYILIAGDLMMFGGDPGAAVEFFKKLRPRRGGYAVLGDAEYREGTRNCIFCHPPGSGEFRRDLPIRTLRDQVVTLDGPDGPAVDLWGLDAEKHPKDLSWATKTRSGRPVIAMTHFPEAIKELSAVGVDMILAGDTHGGQAWGPKLLFRLLLGKERARFLEGRFVRGKSVMFVSRGLGWSILPIRFGVKPEVVIFDFT